jgi:Cyclin, N-terminal domain
MKRAHEASTEETSNKISRTGAAARSQALQPVNPNQRRQSARRTVKNKDRKDGQTKTRSNMETLCFPRRNNQNQHEAKLGVGTASDPLCLFSDDDNNEEEDSFSTRRKSRCHLSSPIPKCRTLKPAVPVFQPPQRYSTVPRGVTNIDKINAEDPLYAVDYVDDMYYYHRQREAEESTASGISYLCGNERNTQPHINERMRSILVDWLIEVHYKFKLFESTLYLTVNMVDRYLEKGVRTSRRELQLVGVTALLIASKYEELYIPELRDLTYICDDAYTADQVCPKSQSQVS